MTSDNETTELSLCDWELVFQKSARGLPSPTFSIVDVRIGPSPSQIEFETHALNTIGSDIAWMDEWLFDKTKRQLKSLIWQVPDFPLTTATDIPEPQPAVFLIVSVGGEIGSTNYRHFTPDRLICLENDGANIDLCLNIAPDLSVLCSAGRWCGWQLTNPLQCLPHGPAPVDLAPCIAKYYDLVSEDTLDDLFDREPELLGV